MVAPIWQGHPMLAPASMAEARSSARVDAEGSCSTRICCPNVRHSGAWREEIMAAAGQRHVRLGARGEMSRHSNDATCAHIISSPDGYNVSMPILQHIILIMSMSARPAVSCASPVWATWPGESGIYGVAVASISSWRPRRCSAIRQA